MITERDRPEAENNKAPPQIEVTPEMAYAGYDYVERMGGGDIPNHAEWLEAVYKIMRALEPSSPPSGLSKPFPPVFEQSSGCTLEVRPRGLWLALP